MTNLAVAGIICPVLLRPELRVAELISEGGGRLSERCAAMGRSGRGGGGGKNQSCYLQVLGLGCDTLDTIPSVLLFFDKERYLFNIGEGFQKFSLEHKIKMAKIDAIRMFILSSSVCLARN